MHAVQSELGIRAQEVDAFRARDCNRFSVEMNCDPQGLRIPLYLLAPLLNDRQELRVRAAGVSMLRFSSSAKRAARRHVTVPFRPRQWEPEPQADLRTAG